MPTTTLYVTIRRRGERYVAEIRLALDGPAVFVGRANDRASKAKRDAERVLGVLDWRPGEPPFNQVAELDLED
jgi:hypothetical protein